MIAHSRRGGIGSVPGGSLIGPVKPPASDLGRWARGAFKRRKRAHLWGNLVVRVGVCHHGAQREGLAGLWGSLRGRCASAATDGGEQLEIKKHLLDAGEWLPTAKPAEDGLISYHTSALYSWFKASRWEELRKLWKAAQYACKRPGPPPCLDQGASDSVRFG